MLYTKTIWLKWSRSTFELIAIEKPSAFIQTFGSNAFETPAEHRRKHLTKCGWLVSKKQVAEAASIWHGHNTARPCVLFC